MNWILGGAAALAVAYVLFAPPAPARTQARDPTQQRLDEALVYFAPDGPASQVLSEQHLQMRQAYVGHLDRLYEQHRRATRLLTIGGG